MTPVIAPSSRKIKLTLDKDLMESKSGEKKPSEDTDSCAICLASMEGKDTKTLYCGHRFHGECIAHWFTTSNKDRCPICRADQQGNPPTPPTPALESLFENDLSYMDNLDIDPLFGAFTTEEGESVIVMESPLGIIMVRTMNITVPI